MRVDDSAPQQFDTLQALLLTARELSQTLAGDPYVARLLRAFQLLPERDRETILQVLEKDASWRRIIEETTAVTGISARPNRHASLYFLVLDENAGTAPALSRDADVIALGVRTLVQIIPLAFQESVHAQWTAAAREVARSADPELRALVVRLAREVETLVTEVDGPAPAAAPSPE